MTASTENYRETLARLTKRLLSGRFLRWWLGELASMVPSWLRAPRMTQNEFFVVRLQDIASGPADLSVEAQRPIALAMPKDRVLRKVLTLPLATEENLRQVLEFQLEQITPFTSGQIYFGYAVLARDFERAQIKVEFVATPREAVDVAIKSLDELGVLVQAVVSDELWSQGQFVNLLPGRLLGAPSPLRQGANPGLMLLLCILALAAIIMPLVIKREAVTQMLPWVEKGKRAAEAVDGVRRELDRRVAQYNFVLEKRQTMPTVIQTLEELTRVLPDDTWVQTIDLKGKELQIQGETASSVRLIGLFEQSSLFKDASFKSPLTKGQASGYERYQLSLQIGAARSAAPLPAAAVSAPPKAPASSSAPAVKASSASAGASAEKGAP